MSILGSATSPFAHQFSLWWIIQGTLIILFALGFIIAFYDYGRIVRLSGSMIIIYGLGEGIATGAIPIEVVNNRLTIQGYIHDILGGVGVASVMALPFLMYRFFVVTGQKALMRFSLIIGIGGIFFFGIFIIAKILNTSIGIFSYGGIWHRLSSINYNFFFILFALLMYRKSTKNSK